MKYKVGDKVRIIHEGSASRNAIGKHNFNIGDVVTIHKLYPDDETPNYYASNGENGWYVIDSEIELYTGTTNMITKPIDFTGCHPDIANALKQGLSIKCKVWDNEDSVKQDWFILGYSVYMVHPYISENSVYKYAEPIKTIRGLRPIEETIPLLLQNGWEFNTDRYLCHKDFMDMIDPKRLSEGCYAINTFIETLTYLFTEIEI